MLSRAVSTLWAYKNAPLSASDFFLSWSRQELAIAGIMAAARSVVGQPRSSTSQSGEVCDQAIETALSAVR
jgi:hypothetical protein